jgi:hypothetical protein
VLTIFSIPKPFEGHNGIIQRNAIGSWTKLGLNTEVVLFGDETGIAETARLFNVVHIPDLARNEYGTPLLDGVFAKAQKIAQHDILIFCNADVILIDDLIPAVLSLPAGKFLACGRRWDLEIYDEIDFSDDCWKDELLHEKRRKGVLHGVAGLDYFVFRRGTVRMPAFAVGRPGWDNWFIFNMRSKNIAVIDVTAAVTAIHQTHDYSHSKFGKIRNVTGPERSSNTKLAGGAANMMSLREANLVMDHVGIRPPPFPRKIFPLLSQFMIWRLALSLRRNLIVKIDSIK